MSIEIAMLRSISFLIIVLGHDFVSEESCRFSVSVCDEGLLLRKFQFESIAQEITQALFDFFDFFLRADDYVSLKVNPFDPLFDATFRAFTMAVRETQRHPGPRFCEPGARAMPPLA